MTQPPYPSYSDPSASRPSHVEPGRLRPVRVLAIVAAVLATLLTMVNTLEAVFAWTAQSTYLDLANGRLVSYDRTPYDLMSAPWLIVSLAAYVATCLWLFRIRKNLEALHPDLEQARAIGWVWGGWLIPFVSFVFPFQIVRDVRHTPEGWRKASDSLVGYWWAFFLVSLIAGRIADRLFVSTITTDSVHALAPLETLDAIALIVSLVLWLQIIQSTSHQQELDISAAR